VLVGLWILLALLAADVVSYWRAIREVGAALARLDVAAVLEGMKAFYPALTFAAGAFVLAALALEFYRGTRARALQHAESPAAALARLIWRNKRRYGGYIVHVGVVLVFVGIAGSSAYQKEQLAAVAPGGTLAVEGYELHYQDWRLVADDDHIGAVTSLTLSRGGRELGRIDAEQRYHPNLLFPELRQAFLRAKSLRGADPAAYREAVAGLYPLMERLEQRERREVKTPSTEVGIHSSLSPLRPAIWGEDVYVIPLSVDPVSGEASFRVFVNPMVNFIWLGGLVFIIGAHICVLPDARERRRLRAALALEEQERAVA
jgi:cytochrome c-type biogenesis protein CcmF